MKHKRRGNLSRSRATAKRSDDFRYLTADKELTDFFLGRGLPFVNCSFWVSDASPEELHHIVGALPVVSAGSVLIRPANLKKLHVRQPNILLFNRTNFQFEAVSQDVFLDGKYISISLGFANEADLRSRRGDIERDIVLQFSLVLGQNSVVCEAYRATYNLYSGSVSMEAGAGTVWKDFISECGGDPTALLRAGFGIPTATDVSLSSGARILIADALQQNDASKRFILLWFALEAEVGDGNNRRKFCEEFIGSQNLSREMKRLHDLRGAYAHRGTPAMEHDDVYSLLSILKLVSLRGTGLEYEYFRYMEENDFFRRRNRG